MLRSDLLFKTDNKPTPAFAALLRRVNVPGNDLREINASLQDLFFKRDPITKEPLERWQFDAAGSRPDSELLRDLALCGFVNETPPEKHVGMYAAWPGGLLPRAAIRLINLVEAWNKGVRWRQNVIHGGKRELMKEKESPSLLRQVPGMEWSLLGLEISNGENGFAIQGVNTELSMMQFLWERAKIPQGMRSLSTVFVDAPMKPHSDPAKPAIRPNSEDCITYWLNNHQPEPGLVFVSSGAPYGMAQDVAYRMLLEPKGFQVETFGHEAPDDLTTDKFMREVAGCVYRIFRQRC